MFNEELHRRLEGEETRELRVQVLSSLYHQLETAVSHHNWEWERGVHEVLGAGIHTVRHLQPYSKELTSMSAEERTRFLQDRWSSLEAAYSAMKFHAYQVMNQNDALEMNLRGLMPQLTAANERIEALEEEVRRLRALVPAAERTGGVLVQDRESDEEPEPGFVGRIRRRLTGHD